MRLCVLILPLNRSLIPLILFTYTVAPTRWTEDDERKRNNKIKEDEIRDYEMKSEKHDPFSGSHSDDQISFSSIDYGVDIGPASSPPTRSQHRRMDRNKPAVSIPTTQVADPQKNWCFSCASPWSTLSSNMQQVIRNLFEMRRAMYPRSGLVSDECAQPKNLETLSKESCSNSYCQTLVLTDHDRGKAFTIRGCAEKFGAIDEKLLEERGDNTCRKLHPNIDIVECVCKKRKYCYSGEDKQRLDRFNFDMIRRKNTGMHSHVEDKVPRNIEEVRNGSAKLSNLCSMLLTLVAIVVNLCTNAQAV